MRVEKAVDLLVDCVCVGIGCYQKGDGSHVRCHPKPRDTQIVAVRQNLPPPPPLLLQSSHCQGARSAPNFPHAYSSMWHIARQDIYLFFTVISIMIIMKIKNTLIEYATYKEFTISKNWESKPEQHSFALKLVQSCIILLHLIRLTKGQNISRNSILSRGEERYCLLPKPQKYHFRILFICMQCCWYFFFWYVFFILKKIMGESFWIHSIRNVKPDECLWELCGMVVCEVFWRVSQPTYGLVWDLDFTEAPTQ